MEKILSYGGVQVQGVSSRGQCTRKRLLSRSPSWFLLAQRSVEYRFDLVAKPAIASGVVLLGELTDHCQLRVTRLNVVIRPFVPLPESSRSP